LVTHDLEEAAMLADQLCILHKGVTLQSGSPLEVAAHPVSAIVARLMDQQNLFTAQVISHDPFTQQTLIRWRGLVLEARYQPEYAPGLRVCWMIQSSNVLLHRRNRQFYGDRENPLSGTIIEYMVLGDHVSVRVEVDKQLKIAIAMTVPVHVARRNDLGYGVQVTISLLAEGIHLMPFVKLRGMREDDVSG
jgi:molybdate transport system ATP-binding protein